MLRMVAAVPEAVLMHESLPRMKADLQQLSRRHSSDRSAAVSL